jgi:hypothetical protein
MTDPPLPRVLNARVVGWEPHPDRVYIGRANSRAGLGESKWHNPYKIPKDGTRDEVVEKYRTYILGKPELQAALHELRGKDLVCWCAPERCHGDVLLELANAEPAS